MKIFKILLLAIIVSTVWSCDDALDREPIGTYSEIDIWSDAKLAEGFVMNVYGNVLNGYYWGYCDDYTDNCGISINRLWGEQSFASEQFDAYYWFFSGQWNRFGHIRKCNVIIEQCTDNEVLPDESKKLFIAEAHALRAMIYYQLAQRFGGAIIVDQVLDSEQDLELPRATIKETYDFIIGDLQTAITNLPETAVRGRLNQASAYAMIARASLQAAAYTGDDAYFTTAKTAAEKVFTYDFELESDYAGLFNKWSVGNSSNEIILGLYKLEENTIFERTLIQFISGIQSNNQLGQGQYGKPLLIDDSMLWGHPNRYPSQDLVNAYYVKNPDGSVVNWDESDYYKNWQTKGGSVHHAMYKGKDGTLFRDARFYASIVYDSTMYNNNLVTTRLGGNLNWGASQGEWTWGCTCTGYLVRKSFYEGKRVWRYDLTNHHRPLIRLGGVYLDYAEACIKTNDLSTAVEYINKTRTTHGNLPALEEGLTVDQVWEEYKRERRVEMAFEDDRYWSLLRWGKYEGSGIIDELNKPIQQIRISEDGTSYEFANIPISRNDTRAFTTARYLMPVPQKEVEENKNLKQNPGW